MRSEDAVVFGLTERYEGARGRLFCGNPNISCHKEKRFGVLVIEQRRKGRD